MRRISSEEVESIWSTTSRVSGVRGGRAATAVLIFVGIEEIGRAEQPVAAPLDALEREARGLGVLQDLRNAGAREPHRVGEVLTRVEVAIGEMAQQRES